MKTIANKIGIKLEKIPERPRELIESIPFPHKCLLRQFIKRVRQNPSELESVIQQAAAFYSVNAEKLLTEVQEVIQYYKENRKDRKQPQNKQEEQEKKENHLFGENIEKILQESHLKWENVQSLDDIERIIEKLGQPFRRFLNSKLDRIAENPNTLKWMVNKLSRKFNV